MHSSAFHVDSARATEERLAALGLTPQAHLDDHIFFTKPAESAGLLLEWSDSNTDDDPRWGYPLREQRQPPVVPARQYAFVTAIVHDPRAVAERLALLLGTEVLRLRERAGPDPVAAIVSLVACLLLPFP